MKKILFASTALVATAGVASADIAFSGGANMGLKYNDGAAEELILHREITLTVAMTGETDGGLTFGADMTITAGGVGDVVVYIEGGFGKLAAGDVGSAVDAHIGVGDLGFDGIGTDNIAEAQIDANDKGSLMYTGTFGDFTVAASWNGSTNHAVAHGTSGTGAAAVPATFTAADPVVQENEFSIAAKYAMGNYTVAVGYDEGNGTDVFSVGLGASIDAFSINGVLSTSTAGESYGLTAGYTMGATTITAAYSKDDVANAEGYGIGFGYDLGGGATLAGAVGEVNNVTVADLGITMSF
ncbi:porin [Aliiroseovarius crassostreae]|uniref:porin n=1 Tax=Aliiroseovarius crassostreae TaxID=154981 RepID=UPI003C7B6B7D